MGTASGSGDQAIAVGNRAFPDTAARGVFAQVMGLVALTVGCTALGAYVGRDFPGGVGIAFFIGALGCVVGLNVAASRNHEQLAIGLLFGLGLCIGLAVAPVLAAYAQARPGALWDAAGTTALFVGALGTLGYATKRDLSSWSRMLFWALLALIVFGIVGIFVTIPSYDITYSVLGLVIFGGFTVVDFNRLRRADAASAVAIAAGIFLDIFNVFLLLLELFGGGRD
jgi:FtsH-binding integral membrane protein